MADTIGELIEEQVGKSNLLTKEIANKLNKHVNMLSYYYKLTSIDTDILIELSDILDFDFFSFFYQNPKLKKFITKDVELLIKDRDELQIELNRKNNLISDLKSSNQTKTEIISDLKEQLAAFNKRRK